MKIIFYKSKEHPDYYFLYKTSDNDKPERMLQKLTHTGEHKDSGYLHVELEMGAELITNQPYQFLDFLVENIATNHIPFKEYNGMNFRVWYEFKEFNFQAWQKKFEEYQLELKKELAENSNNSVQATFNF